VTAAATKVLSVQFSSVRYTLKTYVLRGSGVGLGEEVGLQPPSKLSTTDGGRAQLSWQRVPLLLLHHGFGTVYCPILDNHGCHMASSGGH